jgi:histidyl-tRNA synthetase
VTFGALRGFRDYLPPDAGARSLLRHRMREAARRAGFVELETPSVESLELYQVKSGTEIAQQLWAFQDRGGREVALAPETTPSLARVFADRAKAEPLPAKWFTISRLWRYEEPQAGRGREFGQFNLDILGAPGEEAEVEVLSAGALVLDASGAQGLYAFRLNDRELLDGLAATLGVQDRARFLRALDGRLKGTDEEFRKELEAIGMPPKSRSQLTSLLEAAGSGVPMAKVSPYLDELVAIGLPPGSMTAIERVRKLSALLAAAGLTDLVVFDLGVVRGLAYYTGAVFEAFEKNGDGRALFGGGRYDRLIELFGGPPTPAVGLAIGDMTLERLLRQHDRWPDGEPPLDTYVVAVGSDLIPVAIELVARLRREGVSADWDLLRRSLSRQLADAARRRARRALLVAPREWARGTVVERDLATGSQRTLRATDWAPEA